MAKKIIKSNPKSPKKPISARSKVLFDYAPFKTKHAVKLLIGALLMFLLFIFSLFKNISYPLFWADESMTAMGTERVLEYGYPKVHDGKNVFYDLRHSNPTLGINEKNDAYVGGAGWAQYYFGIIGYTLAKNTDNLFTKTGIFRATFAFAGLLGLVLFGFWIAKLFADRFSQYAFLMLFFLIELFSISLVLLLREVRYYSLVLLLTSVILGMYMTHKFHRPLNKVLIVIVLSLSLWLLYTTFAPVYFIMIASIGLAEFILFMVEMMKTNFRTSLKTSLPVVISLIVSLLGVLPLLSYFRTFEIARAMNEFNNYNSEVYWSNVSTVFNYFKNFELLWLALILKILSGIQIKSVYKNNASVFQASCFLMLVFIVFLFMIGRVPNFIYTRYIIYMQPILAAMIVLDLFIVIREYARHSAQLVSVKMIIPGTIFLVALIFMLSGNSKHISGHLHELTNQYKGPLDFTIPFLDEKYPASDSLVIAANYEETSYMYYLKSKVIMGFTGNNLGQDSIAQPNVIAYRKLWGNYTGVFNKFLQTGQFETEKFPVKDNPVNNIPELNFKPAFNHQFRTLLPTDDKDATYLYLRK